MNPPVKIGIGMVLVGSMILLLSWFDMTKTAHALGLKGVSNVSRPANVTILSCGTGRMRSQTNSKAKCATKQKRRLRRTPQRKSVILKRSAPRYRGTNRRAQTTGGTTTRRRNSVHEAQIRYHQMKARQRARARRSQAK